MNEDTQSRAKRPAITLRDLLALPFAGGIALQLWDKQPLLVVASIAFVGALLSLFDLPKRLESAYQQGWGFALLAGLFERLYFGLVAYSFGFLLAVLIAIVLLLNGISGYNASLVIVKIISLSIGCLGFSLTSFSRAIRSWTFWLYFVLFN